MHVHIPLSVTATSDAELSDISVAFAHLHGKKYNIEH